MGLPFFRKLSTKKKPQNQALTNIAKTAVNQEAEAT
jgi:hypothetical protein